MQKYRINYKYKQPIEIKNNKRIYKQIDRSVKKLKHKQLQKKKIISEIDIYMVHSKIIQYI